MSKATATPPRLKPLTFCIEAIRHSRPDAISGDTPVIADCPLKTGDEVTITPEHQEGGLFWASVFFKREGRPLGRASLDGVPISAFPFETARPVGRPPENAKRIAAWLAWNIHFSREGKRGAADEKTGVQFGYAVADDECKTVRDLRNKDIKALIPALPSYEMGIQLEVEGQQGGAAYIEKPTFYMRNGQLELLGMAWVWHESWDTQAAAYRAIRLTSKIENLDEDVWEKWKSKEGPMLFIVA